MAIPHTLGGWGSIDAVIQVNRAALGTPSEVTDNPP
jgi:hypothetical protein